MIIKQMKRKLTFARHDMMKKKKKNDTLHEHFSIRCKLMISHTLLAIVPVLIIAMVLFSKSQYLILSQIESSNKAYIEKASDLINIKLNQVYEAAKLITLNDKLQSAFEEYDDNDTSNSVSVTKIKMEFSDYVNSLQVSSPNILDVYFIKKNTILSSIKSHGEQKEIDKFYNSDIYKKLLDSKQQYIWTNGFQSSNNIHLLRTVKSIITGEVLGVLVIEVDKRLLTDEMDVRQVSVQACADIMDNNGNSIVRMNDNELISIGFLKRILSNIESNDETPCVVNSKLQSSQEAIVYHTYLQNGWHYFISIPSKAIIGGILAIKKIAIVLTFLICMIALIVSIVIATSIVKPINRVKKLLKQVEQGNFRVESNIVGKYEMGQLSNSFNNMVKGISNLLKNVKDATENINHQSTELNQISIESEKALKDITYSIEAISIGASEQATDAQKSADTILHLVNGINNTETHFNTVVELTTDTRESNEYTTQAINELTLNSKDCMDIARFIQIDMAQLMDALKKISGIIHIINSISDESNLLSLNAYIEAARVGAAGRGFAVVADEINKLAANSKRAANDIAILIADINKLANRTGEKLEKSTAIFEKQQFSVDNIVNTVKDIFENMNRIDSEVKQVYDMFEELEKEQNIATDATSSIAAITEETAASIEQVLTSSEQQKSSVGELVYMSEKLDSVADDLMNQLRHFQF